MNEKPVPHPRHNRSDSKARLVSRFARCRNLIRTKLWILAATLGLGLALAAILWRVEAPSFVSFGRMIVSIKLAIPEGSVYTEELSNFLGTQAALMQSGIVQNHAHSRVTATLGLDAQPVRVKVHVLPKTTIFILQASGTHPQYTQAYLQACMDEYITLKKDMRTQTSDTTVAGLTEEVLRLEKDLHKSEADLAAFQTTNSVVLLQEQGNSAGPYLAGLTQRLAAMRSEYDLLQMLTLDQNLERRHQTGQALPIATDALEQPDQPAATRQDSDYLRARQQILLLKADQEELAQYLRPKHPKMAAYAEEIARRERLLNIFRQQSAQQLASKKSSLALQIENLQKSVTEWDARTLEISRKSAEFQRLKANSTRIQALYDRLLGTMQTLDLNKGINPESVTIMEMASPAIEDRPTLAKKLIMGAVAGAILGLLILLLLDRLDDRMNTFTDLQEYFDEDILGQVPRQKSAKRSGSLELIRPDDDRHAFAESYRNVRSALLYCTASAERPKSLVVTSSIPGEGKSLTSANLAITLANAGSRVLLVDADLRKGSLHRWFDAPPEPGLSEFLAGTSDWQESVHSTSLANLSFLSRGALRSNSSELFLNPITAKLLAATSEKFDFVLLDTAPVMAADDVTSLAPQVDAVLFVIRAEHTSARVARAALDSLYRRHARVLGLLFNAVSSSSGDYAYYQYEHYYPAYPGMKHAAPHSVERS